VIFTIIATLLIVTIFVFISPWSNEVYLLEIVWIAGNIYLNKKIYEIEPSILSSKKLYWFKFAMLVMMLAFNAQIISMISGIIGPGFLLLKVFLAMPIIIFLIFLSSIVFFFILICSFTMKKKNEERVIKVPKD
jgi:hypothetical protein